jgi:hypothetical protein
MFFGQIFFVRSGERWTGLGTEAFTCTHREHRGKSPFNDSSYD